VFDGGGGGTDDGEGEGANGSGGDVGCEPQPAAAVIRSNPIAGDIRMMITSQR